MTTSELVFDPLSDDFFATAINFGGETIFAEEVKRNSPWTLKVRRRVVTTGLSDYSHLPVGAL